MAPARRARRADTLIVSIETFFRVWSRRFGLEVVIKCSTKRLLEGKYHPRVFVFKFCFWPCPHRSSLAVYGRSRHPRAAPTRTKLVTFDRWPFRSDSLRGPRGDMVHRPSGAPSTAPTLPAAVYMLLPTGSLNRADLHTGRQRDFTLAARFDGLVHLTLMF